MQTQLKFQCPTCSVGLQVGEDNAGQRVDCPQCTTRLIVPTAQALVPVDQSVIVSDLVVDEEAYPIRQHGDRYEDDCRPVEMRLGKLAGMKVDVDKKTRNAMATTFLGGILVALGAIVFAMFGGKKSA